MSELQLRDCSMVICSMSAALRAVIAAPSVGLDDRGGAIDSVVLPSLDLCGAAPLD
jgi:hypothetical protein